MKYLFLSLLLLSLCGYSQINMMNTQPDPKNSIQTIVLGGGCFWCVEAIFEQLSGVEKVESGYAGGSNSFPSYEEVCSGTSGHIEVCKITYNSSIISLHDILNIFWQIHDPTTPNRQGNDIGSQYQSVIFCNNETELKLAQEMKDSLNSNKVFPNPVITEIRKHAPFYKAETYHQNYYNLNDNQPYCKFVIQPKLEKFKKANPQKLKNISK